MAPQRKTIVAIAVAAALGQPAANAADKIPTLGEVLKASGLSVSGYVETSFTNFDVDSGQSVLLHAYDTEPRSHFNFHSLTVSGGYQPASGFGAFAELQFGPDANVNAARGTGSSDEFDMIAAYVQYTSGPLTVIGGKFATLAGYEVIESPSNAHFSRSILYFNAIPFTHTGVRVTLAPNEMFKFHVGLNNGWDIVKESSLGNKVGGETARGKTLELGVNASLPKGLSVGASFYDGEEPGTTGVGTRRLLDVVANIPVTEALSLGLNFDMGEQEKGQAGGGDAEWNGIALYASYRLAKPWRLSARLESFDDKDGFRTGTAQKYKEATMTLAYDPSEKSELKIELRQDKADQRTFNGGSDDTQRLIAVQALYKF